MIDEDDDSNEFDKRMSEGLELADKIAPMLVGRNHTVCLRALIYQLSFVLSRGMIKMPEFEQKKLFIHIFSAIKAETALILSRKKNEII